MRTARKTGVSAYGADAPASSIRTRSVLGWEPTRATLLDDIENGDYVTGSAAKDMASSA